MKKISLLILAVLLLSFLGACSPDVQEDDNTVIRDGLKYTLSLDGERYIVTGVAEKGEHYTVLSVLDGIPVTEIGDLAFYDDSAVRSVTIPEGIKLIGSYAFDNCSSIEDIDLPQSIETIGFDAFADCTALKEIRFPSSLKTILKGAFKYCSALERIYINSGLERIGTNVFDGCKMLSEVYLEDVASWAQVTLDDFSSTPLQYAERVFDNGNEIKELTLSGFDKISDKAFYKIPGLESLTLGDGINTVGLSAFSNCPDLKSLVVGDTVEWIRTSGFNSCSQLKHVTMGKSLKRVDGLAFYGCRDIEWVNITDLASWCSIDFYIDDAGSANPMRYADKLLVEGVDVGDDLVIPDGITFIKSLTFISFKGANLYIPVSVTGIETSTFYDTGIIAFNYAGNAEQFNKLFAAIEGNNFSKNTMIYINRPYKK